MSKAEASGRMSILGLDIPAIEKMPGGEKQALVRRILNDESSARDARGARFGRATTSF